MDVTYSVEDGSGVTDATSYVTVDEFKQYWFDNAYVSGSLTDTDIKRLANKASSYIDNSYRNSFPGYRQYDTQSKEWPRSGAFYVDEYEIDEDTVPAEIKASVCEASYLMYTGSDLTETISKSGKISSYSVKVDVIEEETEYESSFYSDIYVIIDSMLSRITGGVNDAFVIKALRSGGESP
jgi:hypothetical protein